MKRKRERFNPVQLLEDMVKVYSPSGEEGALSRLLFRQMRSLGFDVSHDQVGNVIGSIGHGPPEILLCGHMDTVPGEIPVVYKGGRLYGRGTVDAKAPLASMIAAAYETSKGELRGRVTVAAVVDEEGEGKGIRALLKEGLRPDYAVFGEPSGSDKIVIGYKGSLTLNLTCHTVTGHSAAPWLYHNAIEKTFEAWRLISDLRLPEEKNSYFYSVTRCLIRLEGGTGYNIVPNECQARIDIRIPPQISLQDFKKKASQGLRYWRLKNPSVKMRMSWEGGTRGYEAQKDSILVNAFSIAIRKVKNRAPSLIKKTGSSDMNLMAEKIKVPMIAFGPGDSRLDHSQNENIQVKEYLEGIAVLKEALSKLIMLHSRIKG